MKKTVYLAGPVTGLSHINATSWRTLASAHLSTDIHALDPMRGTAHLANEERLGHTYDADPMTTAKGITATCMRDCLTCDAMIVNVTHVKPNKLSAGTLIEMGWVSSRMTIPIILVCEEGNVHREHPIISTLSDYVVERLSTACELVNILLSQRPG